MVTRLVVFVNLWFTHISPYCLYAWNISGKRKILPRPSIPLVMLLLFSRDSVTNFEFWFSSVCVWFFFAFFISLCWANENDLKHKTKKKNAFANNDIVFRTICGACFRPFTRRGSFAFYRVVLELWFWLLDCTFER